MIRKLQYTIKQPPRKIVSTGMCKIYFEYKKYGRYAWLVSLNVVRNLLMAGVYTIDQDLLAYPTGIFTIYISHKNSSNYGK